MERGNEGIGQLSKEEIFGLISPLARRLAFNDPPEIRGKHVPSNLRWYPLPTELIYFPELETYFSANRWPTGAESTLRLEFHNWRTEEVGSVLRRRRVVLPEITELSIYVGTPTDFCAFSIEYFGAIAPKGLVHSPSISLNKRHSRDRSYRREVGIDDLESFGMSVYYVSRELEKVDPQFLL